MDFFNILMPDGVSTFCLSVAFQCPDVARMLPDASTSGGWFGIDDFPPDCTFAPTCSFISSPLHVVSSFSLSSPS